MTRRILSPGAFARKSIAYHARSYALVALAAAAAAAVITGALVVGDSVRGSLEGRVLERLGEIDTSLVAGRFFRQELAAGISADDAARARRVAPAIAITASAVHATSRRRAARVNVFGVTPAFWEFWSPPGSAPPGLAASLTGRSAVLNAALAAALGVAPGDAVLIHVQKPDDIPTEHALGDRAGEIEGLRLAVASVLPDAGLALLDFRRGQETPHNVFVPLEVLARALDREGQANTLLAAAPPGGDPAAALNAALRRRFELADAGVSVRAASDLGHLAVESRELVLAPVVAEAARAAAGGLGCETLEVLTYLANTIAAGGREIPYSTVSAVGRWLPSGDKAFAELPDGAPRPGTLVLNAWAADDLRAPPDTRVSLAYFTLGAGNRLEEATTSFELAGIAPLAGAAADPGWTPPYPGVTDARTLGEWRPPFPVDMTRVRKQDDDYWEAHRTAPKAFVALEDGRRLWASRFGDLTSLRIRPAPAAPRPIAALAEEFHARLRAELDPARLGLEFRNVKAEGLVSARGGTDFGVLFLSFSFFILAAALILVAMLFRLAAERRAKEIGILAASGFTPGGIARVLLADGALLAGAGALVGTAAGVGYAAALIALLRTWWRDAVNAPFLALHVAPASLAIGLAATWLLGSAVSWLVARRMARVPPRELLAGKAAGDTGAPGRRRTGRASLALAVLAAGAALALLAASAFTEALPPAAAFFAAGALLLIAALAGVARALGRTRRQAGVRGRGAVLLFRLGVRQAGRAPGRSLLTAALIASAVFILVAVAAMRRGQRAGPPDRRSGDGGFALVARAATPLTASLATEEGQEALNLARLAPAPTPHPEPGTIEILDRAEHFEFRYRPGDDASCLNLQSPQSPRLLGAPRDFIARGGFAWSRSLAESAAERENPWLCLDRRFPDGAIPAVGDANTVTWILHSGLGKDLTMREEGREVTLRFVGLLSHSIFQGEVLIAEERFVEAFPRVTGRGFFLFAAAPADAPLLAAGLEKDLGDRGLDVEATADLLAAYEAVENTYLSTFQVLGALGLLLGTAGLGAIVLRNVNERRGELALLQAVGFPRRSIAVLVASETAFLLGLGLAAGAGAALIAILPALRGAAAPAWEGLALSLAAVLACGLLSSALAVRAALRAPLIPSLRRE